jgi:hypothetical protein
MELCLDLPHLFNGYTVSCCIGTDLISLDRSPFKDTAGYFPSLFDTVTSRALCNKCLFTYESVLQGAGIYGTHAWN